jgi:hypothetical protein
MLKTLALVVALAASIAAQQDSKPTDVTGTWVIEVESHQLGLELEQKGTAVEGTLYAMGDRLPLTGTYIDRQLVLKGVPMDDSQPPAAGAMPITAKMLDNGTLEGELSARHGRMKFTAERLKKP